MITLPLVVEKLESLPALIARKSYTCEEKRLQWQLKEAEYDNESAKKYLTYKLNYSNKTATELKELVQSDKEVYFLRLECIKSESTYRKEELDRKQLDDEFTGMKVIARIKMSELSTVGGD